MIKIPIHDFSKYSADDQIAKVHEEFMELLQAYTSEPTERIIEEACDLIQATFNLIEMLSPGGVKNALEAHQAKMQGRNYPVKYSLGLEVEG
jgi:phosphoribosyl-ATP pyrophosphohydrolase